MSLTPEQRLARRTVIGSSDAPAVVGVDPYRSSYAVWASKVFDLEDDRAAEREAVEIGNDFEAPLLRWAAGQLGREIEVGVSVRLPGLPLGANLDAKVVGLREGFEAKTTSLPDEWGEEGTDQVPERVIVQAHHQMLCGDLELVWVPVLLARFDRLHRALYRVERNERLVGFLRERLLAFWAEHVETKVPPPLQQAPPLELLKRIRRAPGSEVALDATLVAEWDAKRQARLEAEKSEEEAKARMIEALGTAEAGDYGDPGHVLTYLEQSRAGVDTKALRAQFPEVYAAVERRASYRVPRIASR